MSSKAIPTHDVCALLRSKSFGTLSTLSKHLGGFPFGSVANYCLDGNGHPLFYFSTIAEHTKNIEANAKCSLTVLKQAGGNVQAEGRVTLSGLVALVNDEPDELERYFRYFPASRAYSQFHDFNLYRLKPSAVRYIGGFGKIFWMEPEHLTLGTDLNTKEEAFVIDHMNADHAKSLRGYVRQFTQHELADASEVKMIGIDRGSIDLLVDEMHINIATPRAIHNTTDAREVLVEMAKGVS